MGRGHAHRAGPEDEVELGAVARRVLLGGLLLAALATVIGVVVLWPDSGTVDDLGRDVQLAAPGVTFPTGVVESVQQTCEGQSQNPNGCTQLRVEVLEGQGEGTSQRVMIPPHVAESGLESGDQVRLMRVPGRGDVPASFSYFGTERGYPLWALTVVFLLVTWLVAGKRGALAVVGLGFAGLVIGFFLVPGLLSGGPAIWVGLVGCSAIMFVVLYTTHGFSTRSSVALAGTLAGIAITGALGWVAVRWAHLSGVGDETGGLLAGYAPDLDLQGILTCAVMIAGLGVLNDVTITQASAAWELRIAAPGMSRPALLASAMRIGRDHIASTIYTIAFAYTGTALTLLMILRLYALPLEDLLASEDIAQEIVRTLTTSIGLVLAVPVTTLIAVLLVPAHRDAHAHDPDEDDEDDEPVPQPER